MSNDVGETTSNASYYRLMLYAAIFGALASLLKAGYLTLYNLGIKFLGVVGSVKEQIISGSIVPNE